MTINSTQRNVLLPQIDDRAPKEKHSQLEKESLPSIPWAEIQTMLEKPRCGLQNGGEGVGSVTPVEFAWTPWSGTWYRATKK